jgi:hypothetical protein
MDLQVIDQAMAGCGAADAFTVKAMKRRSVRMARADRLGEDPDETGK